MLPIVVARKLNYSQHSVLGSRNGTVRMHSRDVNGSPGGGCIRVRVFDLLLICADFVPFQPAFLSAVDRGGGFFKGGGWGSCDL